MKKTLKDFTPEIQAKIPEYQKRAVEGVFDGKRYRDFDIEKAKLAIKWNYEKCGYKMPFVIVTENPLEQQIVFNLLNSELYADYRKLICLAHKSSLSDNHKFDSQLDSQMRSQLYSQLVSQLYSQLRSQLVSQLDSQLDSQMRSQLYSQLVSQLYSQLRSQLKSQLVSQLDSQLKKYNNSYIYTLDIYSDCFYAWFKFIKEEFNLPLSVENDFEECFKLQRESGVYSCIFSEQVAVVCKYPKKVYQQSNDFRLHNTETQAVEWGNLFGIELNCYYVKGRNIPKELFEKLKSDNYTFEDFAKEQDEEIKSACIAFMEETKGADYLVSFFRDYLKEVDTYLDKKDEEYLVGTTGGMNVGVDTLFKGNINNTNIAYVRCYCPSTDRMFFLGVHSDYNNAKDAIASLYRVPRKIKDDIKSINRQGERFSTSFTENGLKKLKSLDKKDIEDLVPITGDEYFKLIKYEY